MQAVVPVVFCTMLTLTSCPCYSYFRRKWRVGNALFSIYAWNSRFYNMQITKHVQFLHRSRVACMMWRHWCNVLPLHNQSCSHHLGWNSTPTFPWVSLLYLGSVKSCHLPPKQPGMLSTLTVYVLETPTNTQCSCLIQRANRSIQVVGQHFFRSNLVRSAHQVAWPGPNKEQKTDL